MKGGVTLYDMDERKEALSALKRLNRWLDEEELTQEVMSATAINVIRLVLASSPESPSVP